MFVLFAAEFRGVVESTMYRAKDLVGRLLGKEILVLKELGLISCKKKKKKIEIESYALATKE